MENVFRNFPHNGNFFSTVWKNRMGAAPRGRAYFFTGRGGWVFFIQASWTIIMTWLTDQ